jgi:hypothetical protein
MPAIDFTTCEEHQSVVSEARMVLENEGIPGCRESHTKSSDVIVYCNQEDTFPQSRGACHNAFVPRLQSEFTGGVVHTGFFHC